MNTIKISEFENKHITRYQNWYKSMCKRANGMESGKKAKFVDHVKHIKSLFTRLYDAKIEIVRAEVLSGIYKPDLR